MVGRLVKPMAENETRANGTSQTVASIAQWRSDVRVFFDEEWEQLRTLIMELEANVWNATDDGVDLSVDQSAATQTRRQLNPPVAVEADTGEQTKDEPQEDVTASPAEGRLELLARTIQQRLDGTSA